MILDLSIQTEWSPIITPDGILMRAVTQQSYTFKVVTEGVYLSKFLHVGKPGV